MSTKVKILLDLRHERKDKCYPIVLRLIHNRKSTSIKTGHSVPKTEWDSDKCEVKKSFKGVSSVTRLNNVIQKEKIHANDVIMQMEDSGELNNVTILELKNRIVGKKTNNDSFYSYMSQKADEFKAANRFSYAKSMEETVAMLKKFHGLHKDVSFLELNYKFLNKLEAYYLAKGNTLNSLAVYLRNIRAVFNKAIKEGVANKELYPFQKYTIKTQKTRKRALPREVIDKIELLDLPSGSRMWHAKNYFLFSFYAMGINFVDIAYLSKKNIVNGRLEYVRHKTNKNYSIKINSKIQEILNRYPQNIGYLFPIIRNSDSPADQHGEVVEARRLFNKMLKKIGKLIGLDSPLTSYVARHSWATIAKRKGVPVAVISEGMGHEDVRTTEIYLDGFEKEVLDDFNDLVTA